MKRNMIFVGRVMYLSLLSLTLTEPIEAGFGSVWTRKTIQGNLKEKAQASFDRPERLLDIILESLKEKMEEKKPLAMSKYSLHNSWVGSFMIKGEKSRSRQI